MTSGEAAGELRTLVSRGGNAAALLLVLFLGVAGGILLALPHQGPASVARPPDVPGPTRRQEAIGAIDETIAAVEAYYTDHRTYRGISQSLLPAGVGQTTVSRAPFDRWLRRQTLLRYGVGFAFSVPGFAGVFSSTAWSGHVYFADDRRYCVEFQQGLAAWSRNGPLAPLQPGLCRRRTLRLAPAPHDGEPPDLPLLPRQAPVPRVLQEDEVGTTIDPTPEQTAADALEGLAVELDVYWLAHGGTYSGARRALGRASRRVRVVRAAGNDYCLEASVRGRLLVKNGPSGQIRAMRPGTAPCA